MGEKRGAAAVPHSPPPAPLPLQKLKTLKTPETFAVSAITQKIQWPNFPPTNGASTPMTRPKNHGHNQ